MRRFADHSRHHPDIVAIQFHAVPVARLDEAERQMIQNQRDAGHHLRNIDVVSRTWGDSVLDAVIDQEEVQASWANGEPQTHPDDLRMLMAKRRRSTATKYRKLKEVPSCEDVFADVCIYLDRVIPWPPTTDGRFWTVSAMPATNRTRDEQRLVTINCGKVEAFVVIEDRSTHEAWRFLNLEHGILKKHDLPPDPRECFSSTDGYRSAGRLAVAVIGTAPP